jgi:hypothetical protein
VLVVVDVAGLVDKQYRNAVLDAVSAPQPAGCVAWKLRVAQPIGIRTAAEGIIVEG